LKGNSSNIQTSKSGWTINKVFFVSFSISHYYKWGFVATIAFQK
jgi:hypothetical protein